MRKEDWILLSSAISLGLSFVLLFVWTIAVLNGGIAYVSVNELNESFPELIMWVVIIPLITVGFYYHYTGWKNGSSTTLKTKKE